MNNSVRLCNVSFGEIVEHDGTYKFKDRIIKDELCKYYYFRNFAEYKETEIEMESFVNGLQKDGWLVHNVIENEEVNLYQLYSSKYNVLLNLKISKNLNFQHANIATYEATLNKLRMMDRRPVKKYKTLKVMPKTHEILSKRAKIALVTLTTAVTAIFSGATLINAISQSKEAKSNDAQTKYEQTYQESKVPGVSLEAYEQSVMKAKEKQAQNSAENRLNEQNNTSIDLNQNKNYYYDGNIYYKSPIPNVSDESYNQSIQAAQQRQIR